MFYTLPPLIGDQPDWSHPLMQGLALWLPLQDGGGTTAFDVSGLSRNGTLTNMDPATGWVISPFSTRCLDFDGSNDYVDVGNLGLSVVTGGTYSVTVAFWIYIPSGLTDGLNVFTQASGAFSDSGMIGYRSTSHSSHGLGIRVWPGTGAGGGLWKSIVPVSAVTENEWCHVAAVFQPGGSCTGYHNGKHYNTVTVTDLDFASAAMQIGNRYLGVYAPGLTGRLFDFRIWKTALSDNAIREIYCDPWAPFSRRRTPYLSVAGGGGGSIAAHVMHYRRMMTG